MTIPDTMRLGRKESPLDIQDYKLSSFIPIKYNITGERNWSFIGEPLYQGTSNHCCGFSMANWGINLPVQSNYTNQDGHDFYYMCKVIEGEPEAEDGAYIRTAAKVLRNLGKINIYAFAYTADEIAWWVLNKGPVIVGTLWTMDMFTPDANNTIYPTGEVAGGHAYLINEKTSDNMFGIQNSWDGFWGINGKAYISIEDFASLFRRGGEAIAAVELDPSITGAGDKEGCLTALLKMLNIK